MVQDYGASWQLSRIWSWDGDIGPLGVFLPLGLYGMITVYLSRFQLTALARRIHGSSLTLRVYYVSGRETLFRGSLGSGHNVCTIMPCLLSFNESHLSALWPSPYT
jgi:hypothetical protein